jgi:hypothetical protein
MEKCAVILFDASLHDISLPGSHYTIVVPNATNEEVAKIINDVSVWNDYYVTKSVRLLKEAGHNPIVLDGLIYIHPHSGVEVHNMYPEEKEKGIKPEEERYNYDDQPEDIEESLKDCKHGVFNEMVSLMKDMPSQDELLKRIDNHIIDEYYPFKDELQIYARELLKEIMEKGN